MGADILLVFPLMGKAEWGGDPVCWWLGLCFCCVCCLDEASCTGCYWWLGDARSFIQVVSFVWVLTIWYSVESMGSQRVRHNWTTSLSLFTFMYWKRKWQPTPVSLPGESQGWQSPVGCRLWGRDLAAAAEDEMAGWHHRLDRHEFE